MFKAYQKKKLQLGTTGKAIKNGVMKGVNFVKKEGNLIGQMGKAFGRAVVGKDIPKTAYKKKKKKVSKKIANLPSVPNQLPRTQRVINGFGNRFKSPVKMSPSIRSVPNLNSKPLSFKKKKK